MTDLGPMPEPVIEPGEPNPGGVDAPPDDATHTIPDPPLADNPTIQEKVPEPIMEEVADTEDTSTSATRSESGASSEQETRGESPA